MAQTSAHETQLTAVGRWKAQVYNWYPSCLHRTYCVPHVYFNRVPYKRKWIAGQEVFVLDPEFGSPSQASQSGGQGQGQTTEFCSGQANQIHESPRQASRPRSAGQASQAGQSRASGQAVESGEPWPPSSELIRFQKSDLGDDKAQSRMLTCLKALGDSRSGEGMFIISSLKIRHILKRFSAPKLPEGDFDIIMVNRDYGICIGEIKSVGLNWKRLRATEDEKNVNICERVDDGVKQLKKCVRAMEIVTRDVKEGLGIQTTLILPYVTRAQLQRAVKSHSKKKLAKVLRICLGVKDTMEATQLCICRDEVPDSVSAWCVPANVVSNLNGWFLRRFPGKDSSMSDDVYLNVAARLCGPATVVEVHCPQKPRLEVHTIPEAVSQTGERLTAQVVLTPEQLDLLHVAPERVWITGPPGTGKTITAVLMGLVWLEQGFDVHVVSCCYPSIAASEMICHQLDKGVCTANPGSDPSSSCHGAESSPVSKGPRAHDGRRVSEDVLLPGSTIDPAYVDRNTVDLGSIPTVLDPTAGPKSADPNQARSTDSACLEHDVQEGTHQVDTAVSQRAAGRPHLHEYDFHNREEDTDKALTELLELAGPGKTLHVIVDECDIPSGRKKARYKRFFEELIARVKDLHMWVISVDKSTLPREMITEVTMSLQLRCPPSVFRLVEPGVDKYDSCYKYSPGVCPAPSDGPPVIWLNHAGPGHTGQWPQQSPIQCRQCGTDVASTFRQLAGIPGDSNIVTARPPSLNAGDFLILTYCSDLTQTCEFVAGLQSQDVPVRVMPWDKAFPSTPAERQLIKDAATAAGDMMTVAHPFWVKGLERKVVVCLPGRDRRDPYGDDDWVTWDRLQSMSRCTAQLIIVQCPGHPLQKNAC